MTWELLYRLALALISVIGLLEKAISLFPFFERIVRCVRSRTGWKRTRNPRR